MILEAFEAGLRIFGESRVQEVQRKSSALGEADLMWHMIGHLQKNKARQAVALFDLIHSVDSEELAGLLNKYAGEAGKLQNVLIEVKLSHEEAKHGVAPERLGEIIKATEGMKNIKIEGLMTMPPYSELPEDSRPYYKRLKGLADEFGLRKLSMGMSHDFEIAVEEGATLVRVGTAIFGERIK